MIAALARKLLIALWRLVTTGEVSEGIALRAACLENVYLLHCLSSFTQPASNYRVPMNVDEVIL
jgi:hypothetical protein